MDDFLLFPCNIDTNEATSTIISLEMFGKLNIFNKMEFQEVYVMKMKISDFLKTHFFRIIFSFIDGFTLNSDNNKKFMKFWTLLAFVGLHWPLWPWIFF